MAEYILQPWPWYVAGPIIGLTVPLLLLLGNKHFGISANLRHICAACLPARIPFFRYEWKNESLNLFFAAGILVGGWIAVQWLSLPGPVLISEGTAEILTKNGITPDGRLMPAALFDGTGLLSIRGIVFTVVGGFLVGFGTRYAGGCTSGHSIMGLSTLQWPSLVATCSFMAGGFVMAHFLLPYLLQL